MEKVRENKIYLVIGDSQAGKTSFINSATGSNLPAKWNIGKSLTKNVTHVNVSENSKTDIFKEGTVIIDTPGLFDSDRSDEEITEEILISFLNNNKNVNPQLDGIIYINPITVTVFNLERYIKILKKLSKNIDTSNILVIFTRSYIYLFHSMVEEIKNCKSICEHYKIENYMFWDSEKTIEDYDQRDLLFEKLKKITPLKLDKLESFQEDVKTFANQLREKNKKIVKRERKTNIEVEETDPHIQEVVHTSNFEFNENFGFHLYAPKKEHIRSIEISDPDAVKIISGEITYSYRNCGEPYSAFTITGAKTATAILGAKCHIGIESTVTFHVRITYLKRIITNITYTKIVPITEYEEITEYDSIEKYLNDAINQVIHKYVDEIKKIKPNMNHKDQLAFPSSISSINKINDSELQVYINEDIQNFIALDREQSNSNYILI